MKVTVKKDGDAFRIYVETEALGETPAGDRLYTANHPQHPFPKAFKFDDGFEAHENAEKLADYLEQDEHRKRKARRNKGKSNRRFM